MRVRPNVNGRDTRRSTDAKPSENWTSSRTSGSGTPSHAALRVELQQRLVQLGAGLELAAAGVALEGRDARRGVGQQDVHRHAGRQAHDRRHQEPGPRLRPRRQREAVALVVRRRAVLEPQVGRIDRPVGERDLIVVGVVQRLAERVRGPEPDVGAAALGADEQRVVVRVHARLEVDDAIRAADHRVEHLADRAADDEVRAEVVHAVHAQHDAVRQGLLDAEVPLLDARVLHRVVDDVDARGAGAGQDEAGERIGDRRRERRELAGVRVEEEHVAGLHLDRQRPPVEAALERLDLQRDAVVVDAVAAVDAEPAVAGRPVEADARAEVVAVALPLALQERLDDRVDLVVAADVLDVGVRLPAQPEVQREVGPDAPVVLDVEGEVVVVGVRDDQRLIRLAAAQGHREQQIVVVDAAVAVVVEVREVLHHLEPAVLEDAEIEERVDALPLAAGPHRVRPADQRHAVGELEALLRGALRDAERRAVLDARERQLRPAA